MKTVLFLFIEILLAPVIIGMIILWILSAYLGVWLCKEIESENKSTQQQNNPPEK